MRPAVPSQLIALAASAAGGFWYTARLVSRRAVHKYDHELRNELQAVRAPAAESVAEASGPLGKEHLHFPAALGLGLALRARGLGPRAAVPVLASVLAEAMNRLVTQMIHIRVVPPGHPEHDEGKPSFPSGHAMETTAVALTAAYVLSREGVVRPAPSFAFAALLVAASAGGRLILDRHWVSDAVGGMLLGVVIASTSAAAYEALPS